MTELPEHIKEELVQLCAHFSIEHNIPPDSVKEFVLAIIMIMSEVGDMEIH